MREPSYRRACNPPVIRRGSRAWPIAGENSPIVQQPDISRDAQSRSERRVAAGERVPHPRRPAAARRRACGRRAYNRRQLLVFADRHQSVERFIATGCGASRVPRPEWSAPSLSASTGLVHSPALGGERMLNGEGITVDDAINDISELLAKAYRRDMKLRVLSAALRNWAEHRKCAVARPRSGPGWRLSPAFGSGTSSGVPGLP
jgi:hypothetical protein